MHPLANTPARALPRGRFRCYGDVGQQKGAAWARYVSAQLHWVTFMLPHALGPQVVAPKLGRHMWTAHVV
jgi:hypothetical protein